MSAIPSLMRRLSNVLVPTTGQVLGTLFLSLTIIAATQSSALFQRIGLPAAILSAGQDQFHQHFDAILNSSPVSQGALISFWAIIGLVTYLVCWGAYNLFIEARNEVTLTTAYTNRGHWHSSHATLALKAVAAVGLAGVIGSLRFGLALWLALAGRFTTSPSFTTAGWCLFGIIGLAFEFYLILVFIQLTFTPWYRAIDTVETFTEP